MTSVRSNTAARLPRRSHVRKPPAGRRQPERRGGHLGSQNPHPRGRTMTRSKPMSTFVFRLKALRATFALDMTDQEREVMGRHAAYWQRFIDSGQMVVFGPVLDGTGSWGLGVIEAEDDAEDDLRAFAAGDPVAPTETAEIDFGKMVAGFVRPR